MREIEVETPAIAAERERAVDHLTAALAIFDRVGPLSVAATVSLALTQAGREPPPPPPCC